MDIKQKAKDELETRVQKIEDYIAEKGLGSTYLSRAKKIQRNLNLAIAVGSLITVAGITLWALSKNEEED